MPSTAVTAHGARWPAVVAIAAVVAAVASNLFRLGAKSLTLDESATVVFARLPWDTFAEIQVNEEVNMGTHYVLLRPFARRGASEELLRLPSVVFAVLAVALIYLVGKRLFGARVGATAAALLAVSPFAVEYGQTVRGYSLVLMLSVLTSWLILVALDHPETARWWVLWVVATTLAWYTHPFGVLISAAQIGAALLAGPPVPRRRWWIAATALVPLVVLVALMGGRAGRPLDWVPAVGIGTVARFAHALAGRWPPATIIVVPLAALGAVAAVAASWSSRRSGRGLAGALVLLWFAVPVVAVFGVSLVSPIYVLRYLIGVLPAFLLLVACGIWHPALRRLLRPAPVLLTLLVLAVTTVPLVRQLRAGGKEEYRAAAEVLIEEADPDDAVLFPRPYNRMAIELYAEAAGAVPPPALTPPVPWGDLDALGRAVFLDEVPPPAGDHRTHDDLWVVTRDEQPRREPPPYEVDLEADGYVLVEEHRFKATQVRHFHHG